MTDRKVAELNKANNEGGTFQHPKDKTIHFTFCKIADRSTYYRGKGQFGYEKNETEATDE